MIKSEKFLLKRELVHILDILQVKARNVSGLFKFHLLGEHTMLVFEFTYIALVKCDCLLNFA